ncbi:hypothetical protein [Massilia sp.]|uniref:hypothetical protein n=1 Tax=Massilia sp. TaxID=1882437 RepID=UPI00352F4228
MKGVSYVDLGATCKVSENVMAYAKIDNVANRNAPTSGNGINPSLYDLFGRMYRAGVRFTF